MTVLVIGGGITGLAAAARLQSQGRDWLLVEASGKLGGKIETERRSDYLLEWGPHSIVSTGTALFDFADALGVGDAIVGAKPEAKRRYVSWKGGLAPLPAGPGGLLRTPLLSFRDKLRIFKEPFVRSRGGPEESAFDFVARRFGRRLAEHFLAPFVSGIYAGDAERLEMASAFPKIARLEREHGSVLKGMKHLASDRGGRPRGTFGFREGMATIVLAAARHLGDRARTRSTVRTIARGSGGGFRVDVDLAGRSETLDVKRILVTTPAREAAALLADIAPEIAAELRSIVYPPVGLLEIGVRESDLPRALDGFGFLALPSERLPFLGCIWSSTVFPGRAPEGRALLSVFLGGARFDGDWEQPNEDEVSARALSSLGDHLGGSIEPDFRAFRWIPRAIPQLEIGHASRLARVREGLSRLPGLLLAGGHIDGVSMHDCIASGWRAADAASVPTQKSVE
ncbi:MAG: protoporphyrinogen oxidase [Planctomycetes bacterium]|nr:protoporphyrinogen oxidase [Planctomycetota bacterium]